MISASRQREVRLWWPLPLAVLVWLLLIWGVGFFLNETESEVVSPPPIEAHFIDLPESDLDLDPLPPPPKGAQVQPDESQTPQPAQVTPPTPRPSPPARPQTRPQAIEEIETVEALPERREAETATAPEAAPTDLSEYIDQARANRRPRGIFDGDEFSKTDSAEPQPTADEVRMANVRRNLQVPGTSGIFRIVNIGPRFAQFTFRSWTTGDYNPRRVLVEVEAGPDGDVERAIIRKMIELIRQFHQEDFNWESQRLNRVIVLSARMRDNDGLEDFLMREFFINTPTPHRR